MMVDVFGHFDHIHGESPRSAAPDNPDL